MHREVKFSIFLDRPIEPKEVPEGPIRNCAEAGEDLPAYNGVEWRLVGDDVRFTKEVRHWIASQHPAGFAEDWFGYIDTPDERAAHNIWLPLFREVGGVSVETNRVVDRRFCHLCDGPIYALATEERLVIKIASRLKLPTLFRIESGPLVIAEPLRKQLEKLGLMADAVLVPIQVRPPYRGPHLFAVCGGNDLGMPVAPFGTVGVPCGSCGAYRAMYAFYQSYAANAVVGHWMFAYPFGPGAPLFSSELKQWIVENWKLIVDGASTGRTAPVFLVLGIDPTNRDTAFLAPSLHADIADLPGARDGTR